MADEAKIAPGETARAGTASTGRSSRRSRTGEVVSDGRDKTVSVVVNFLMKHRKYGKLIRRRTKLSVHDPANAAKVGDVVEIAECRPVSKTKSWRLVRVVTAR